MSMGQTLFEKYGDSDLLVQLIEVLHLRLVADQELSPFFQGIDWKRLLKHQVAFLAFVMDGPKSYQGRDMRSAHQHLHIQHRHFDAILEHLRAAMLAAGMEEEDSQLMLQRVQALRTEIVKHGQSEVQDLANVLEQARKDMQQATHELRAARRLFDELRAERQPENHT